MILLPQKIITMDGGGGYHECCGNVLKAHATTYHLYRKTFQKRFKGLLETKSVHLMFASFAIISIHQILFGLARVMIINIGEP